MEVLNDSTRDIGSPLLRRWRGSRVLFRANRGVRLADPDIFLLATQYSLIDHEDALEKTLPVLEEKKASVVVGAPLMAGYLAGRERYLYSGTIPPGAPEKRRKLTAVADQ